MSLEGYGKVLSRPGLEIKSREMAIVACLIVDNRRKQLDSHIRGALNVGIVESELRAVIEDVGQICGVEIGSTLSYLKRLKTHV